MTRILLVDEVKVVNYAGGIEKVLCDFSNEFVKRNYTVDFLCLDLEKGQPFYEHTLEGLDDMPAHGKSTLTGVSLTIPITNGRLNLGTWQGIYLCEFRDSPSPRRIVATVIGE